MSGAVQERLDDKKIKQIRKLATQSIPGKHSALWYLNYNILGKANLIPMTYRAHLGMLFFAEGATGIPEIDDARVKMILVPRDLGKSSLVTKGLPILNLLRNRNFATGIANEKQDLADTFLADIKHELSTNQLLRQCFPELIVDPRDTIWKADRFIVNRDKLNPTSPSMLSTGVGGTVTGVHMDAWILDDLLSKNAAEAARRGNYEEIEKTNRWMVQLEPLLSNPASDDIHVIGTKWWEGDSYEFAEKHWGMGQPKQEFMWTLNLPPQTLSWDYDRDGKKELVERAAEVQHHKLYVKGDIAVFTFPARDENGRSVFPERYNEEELRKMQMRDPEFFAGQMLLDPKAEGTTAFDKNWINYYSWEGTHQLLYHDHDQKPRYVPVRDLTVFISVDPAFSKKHTAARTAIPVVGIDGKNLFLLEDFAVRTDSEDEIAAKVLEFYLLYSGRGANVNKIFVETIVAQVAVANAIRRRFREAGLPEPPIEEIKSHGKTKKQMRIWGLESYLKRGIFYARRQHTDFMDELIGFPRSVKRDILDALAFQADDWEKIFLMQHHGQGMPNQADKAQAEAAAIERIHEAWGRRRYRR